MCTNSCREREGQRMKDRGSGRERGVNRSDKIIKKSKLKWLHNYITLNIITTKLSLFHLYTTISKLLDTCFRVIPELPDLFVGAEIMSHQESIDRGVGEDGLNSRVKEAHVYNVPVVRLIHTEVSVPARFPCLYSERITEIQHLVIQRRGTLYTVALGL